MDKKLILMDYGTGQQGLGQFLPPVLRQCWAHHQSIWLSISNGCQINSPSGKSRGGNPSRRDGHLAFLGSDFPKDHYDALLSSEHQVCAEWSPDSGRVLGASVSVLCWRLSPYRSR